jgi:hypothetical protein
VASQAIATIENLFGKWQAKGAKIGFASQLVEMCPEQNKNPRKTRTIKSRFSRVSGCLKPTSSALTSFVALLHFVDDVDTALATHQPVGAVTIAQGLERIANFHQVDPDIKPPVERPSEGSGHMPDFSSRIKMKLGKKLRPSADRRSAASSDTVVHGITFANTGGGKGGASRPDAGPLMANRKSQIRHVE